MSDKRVLLHGAVNSSNFGDCLFVELFYKAFKEAGGLEPVFLEGKYGISDFNRRAIGYAHNETVNDAKSADALVYISGGYFGDDSSPIWMSWRRWARYFRIAGDFVRSGRPIAMAGVGGGPLKSRFTEASIKRVVENAVFVTVRDLGTLEMFDSFAPGKARLTNDTALIIEPRDIPPIDCLAVEAMNRDIGKCKYILLHVTGVEAIDRKMTEMVVPALGSFVSAHSDLAVVVTCDCQFRQRPGAVNRIREILQCPIHYYEYHSPRQLCAVINEASLVVTPKLHVGIVGSALGRPVASFPAHPYKTQRFYDGIDEGFRCEPLSTIDEKNALKSIKRNFDLPVVVPETARMLAQKNVSECVSVIVSRLTDA